MGKYFPAHTVNIDRHAKHAFNRFRHQTLTVVRVTRDLQVIRPVKTREPKGSDYIAFYPLKAKWYKGIDCGMEKALQAYVQKFPEPMSGVAKVGLRLRLGSRAKKSPRQWRAFLSK
jgi:hypothetical protein